MPGAALTSSDVCGLEGRVAGRGGPEAGGRWPRGLGQAGSLVARIPRFVLVTCLVMLPCREDKKNPSVKLENRLEPSHHKQETPALQKTEELRYQTQNTRISK